MNHDVLDLQCIGLLGVKTKLAFLGVQILYVGTFSAGRDGSVGCISE